MLAILKTEKITIWLSWCNNWRRDLNPWVSVLSVWAYLFLWVGFVEHLPSMLHPFLCPLSLPQCRSSSGLQVAHPQVEKNKKSI